MSSFTDADIRMLIITIVGTVAGALITLVLAGLAVIAARHFREDHLGTAGWVALLAALAAALVFYPVDRKLAASTRDRRWVTLSYGPVIVFAVLAVLTLIGLAAGIK